MSRNIQKYKAPEHIYIIIDLETIQLQLSNPTNF